LAKVLLLSPPSRATTPRPPLGLMYVSSSLSRNGIDNDIIDIKGQMNIDKVLAETLRLISGSDTDIIGISCLVTEIEIVEEMCRKIKELKPKTTIVLGGAQPSTHPEHFDVAKEYIDYFVMGEGEITFPELVTALRDGRNTKDIKGLAWFESGLIVKSPPRELIKDLDTLPPPAYDKVDMARYTRPTSWGLGQCPYLYSGCSHRAAALFSAITAWPTRYSVNACDSVRLGTWSTRSNSWLMHTISTAYTSSMSPSPSIASESSRYAVRSGSAG
jgi:radical SAM superfamily enzyme YgiQ (UPF0313 family)